MNVTIETKVCTKCGEDKPFSDFHKDKSKKGGYRAHCKVCVRAEQKAYREEVAAERVEPAPTDTKVCTKCNEDKPLTDFHKRSASLDGLTPSCKSCVKAARKAHYEANSEKNLAAARAYREANRGKIAAHHAERYSNDPEYRARYAAAWTRRDRMLASAVQEPYLREDIFERDNWTCGLCDEPIDSELKWPERGSASIDHVIPISHGGDDTPDNVQAAHLTCNQSKGNRVELEDLQAA